MSAQFAIAQPRRIKATHRRRRRIASGPIVQRYYDPLIGRFLSVDPMASDTTTGWNFNRYSYANNNPYLFTDPDGRAAILDKLKEWFSDAANEIQAQPYIHAQGTPEAVKMIDDRVAARMETAGTVAVTLMSVGVPEAGAATKTGQVVASTGKAAGELFFEGATLSQKVVGQMKTDALHGFSKAVDGFAAGNGVVKTVLDSRGKPVEMLTVRGGVGKSEGTFEYIKNQAGEIYHRFFKADP